ncbi:MAG: hypothetical protein ACI9FJ_001612, partial [Alteromonadaceae bacterium]
MLPYPSRAITPPSGKTPNVTSKTSTPAIIGAMQRWIETVIVKYNFCPFARKEVEQNSIAYHIVDSGSYTQVTEQVLEQCHLLDNDPAIATTLVILINGFDDFDNYLGLVDEVQSIVIDPHYEGTYQLASFHPQYCFA